MSDSKDKGGVEHKIVLEKNAPLPPAGYEIVFDEELAKDIAEFVSSPFYKRLKRAYRNQAIGRAARQCLSSANDVTWLHYYKGMAASTQFFFIDMEATQKAYRKANDPDFKDDDEKEAKK